MEPVVRLLTFTALAGATFIPLERLFGRRRGPRRDRLTDLGFATLGEWLAHLGIAAVVGGALSALDALSLESPLFAGIHDRTLRAALEIGVGLLVFEVMSYAYHRAAHRVPLLWRLHQVHHSAPAMDWLASFRQHPLEIVAMTLIQNAPLVLLDLPVAEHLSAVLILRLATVFVHADLPVPRGWWSRWVVTPGFHHRHHQRDGAVCNYASLLPVLDRLMGTFDDAPAGPVGLAGPSPTGFWGLLFYPVIGSRGGPGVGRRSNRGPGSA